jgi:hypothetical protein
MKNTRSLGPVVGLTVSTRKNDPPPARLALPALSSHAPAAQSTLTLPLAKLPSR